MSKAREMAKLFVDEYSLRFIGVREWAEWKLAYLLESYAQLRIKEESEKHAEKTGP